MEKSEIKTAHIITSDVSEPELIEGQFYYADKMISQLEWKTHGRCCFAEDREEGSENYKRSYTFNEVRKVIAIYDNKQYEISNVKPEIILHFNKNMPCQNINGARLEVTYRDNVKVNTDSKFRNDEQNDLTISDVGTAIKKLDTEKEIIVTPELLKVMCVNWFYWWYNQHGNNTSEGWDKWYKIQKQSTED